MTTQTKITRFLALLLFFCGLSAQASADGTEYIYQSRLQVNADLSLAEKLNYSPSLQFYFSDLYEFSSYQFGNSLRYRLCDLVTLAAGYNMNISHDGGTELNHQYSLSATLSKRYGSFSPSLRFYYSDYLDSDITDFKWFRLRGRLGYSIPNSRFSPYISADPTFDVIEKNLFRVTYVAGTTYSMTKGRQIHAYYRIDDYKQSDKLRQVFCLSYRIGF